MPSLPLRVIAGVLVVVQLFTSPAGLYAAQGRFASPGNTSSENYPAPVRTPMNVQINRTVPKVKPPTHLPQFSASPRNQEIFAARVLDEPLVPIADSKVQDLQASQPDNKALARVLQAYLHRKKWDDVSALTKFLQSHPRSAWRAGVLVNLGIRYRASGYFSRALEVWEEAWGLLKGVTDARAKGLADRAVAELTKLNSSLGRYDQLEALLDEAKGREMFGAPGSAIIRARENLWLMENRPGTSFKCGPYALNSIRAFHRRQNAHHPLIREAASSRDGFSLAQVHELSTKLGMDYQMAWRSPKAPLLLPCVVHWKSGHYAAILAARGEDYLVRDPTFGPEMVISQGALEDESSGYFLVPAGRLPSGWKPVSADAAGKVWGRGVVDERDPDATKCEDEKGGGEPCRDCKGMARYTVNLLLVSLQISDTPVGYSPPVGPPVDFTVTYNRHEENQLPSAIAPMGPSWTHNWISYVTDGGAAGSTAYVLRRGGGRETYLAGDYQAGPPGDGYYGARAKQAQSQLVVISTNSPRIYERRLPNGSVEVYGGSNYVDGSGRAFLKQIKDSQGTSVTLQYDGSYRLASITDAVGQVTTFHYDLASPSDHLVTRVVDPFGRTATFSYDSSSPRRLIKITDTLGLASQFSYETGSVVSSMTTPYGTTSFDYSEFDGQPGVLVRPTRVLEVTDPLGGRERFESWIAQSPGYPSGEPDWQVPQAAPYTIENGFHEYRCTFYWDRKAMQEGLGNDRTKSIHYHFLHKNESQASPILQSIKRPLEGRVWYIYPDQDQPNTAYEGSTGQPIYIGRVLDDSTSQIYRYAYNSVGMVTNAIEPAVDGSGAPINGRTFSYDYAANGIDRVMTRQTRAGANDVIQQILYDDVNNPLHVPAAVIDASGQMTTNTYNAQGQVTSVTRTRNGSSETTTLEYSTSISAGYPTTGLLKTVTGPVGGSTTTYTYDPFGRIRTVTDSEGYAITYDYDAMDRPTVITYPDGTYEQFAYNRLDREWARDRLGRWTRTFHDALQRVAEVHDPLGRVTSYQWCICGALSGLIDPNGNLTSWFQDLQGRTIAKAFPDGGVILYEYEYLTSRLKSITDPKGQITHFYYNQDNTRSQVAYSRADRPTPTVTFTYDPDYQRLASMTDGTGTTTYSYYTNIPYASWPPTPTTGAGRLATNSGPLASITYTYDEYGRQKTRSIDGNNNKITTVYDALGRVTGVTNNLGAFAYAYTNTTSRLSSVAYPNGQTNLYDYFPNTGDQRLKQIKHLSSTSSVISQFDYTYNAAGEITTCTRQLGASTTNVFGLEYDAAGQLTAATKRQTGTDTLLKRHAYRYDPAGNRTSEQEDLSVTSASYNNANQLTSRSSGGPLRFVGVVSEQASVTVDGNAATVSGTNFVGYANVTAGTNNVSVVARDLSGMATTNTYEVVVTAGAANTLTYDRNGNLVSDGTRLFEWDAADRLVGVTIGTNVTEFVYDGMNRRVGEKLNGTIIKQRVWCETQPCEERDGSNNVTKRFFGQGIEAPGETTPDDKLCYTRDHLGSIRELVDSSGALRARYDYDPYGRTSKVTGDLDADFGFTGHYRHAASGLYLAMYRAYDPGLGRWISRDPLEGAEDKQGPNLYTYCQGSPLVRVDPDGRVAIPMPVVVEGGALIAIALYLLCLSDPAACQKALEALTKAPEKIFDQTLCESKPKDPPKKQCTLKNVLDRPLGRMCIYDCSGVEKVIRLPSSDNKCKYKVNEDDPGLEEGLTW